MLNERLPEELDRSVLLFPVEIVGVETIYRQELAVAVSQCATRKGYVDTRERHDYIKDRILVKVLFRQSLDLRCHPWFLRRSTSRDLFIWRTMSIKLPRDHRKSPNLDHQLSRLPPDLRLPLAFSSVVLHTPDLQLWGFQHHTPLSARIQWRSRRTTGTRGCT